MRTVCALLVGLLCTEYAISQSPHVCPHEEMCTVDSECGQGRSCVDYGDHKCCSEAANETVTAHVCDPADVCTMDNECATGSTCVNYGDHNCCTVTSASSTKVHTCPHSMCNSNADCGGHGRRCKNYGDHGCCVGGHGAHVCDPADVCTMDKECATGSTCVNYGDHNCCTVTSASSIKVHTCPHSMCNSNADCGGHGRRCKNYGDHGCCVGGHGAH